MRRLCGERGSSLDGYNLIKLPGYNVPGRPHRCEAARLLARLRRQSEDSKISIIGAQTSRRAAGAILYEAERSKTTRVAGIVTRARG